MSYEDVASFAQTWGLLIFVAVFAVIVAYAVWPKNKKRFDEAARIPLEDDKPKPDDRRNGKKPE
ncbi:CcoQ/FixQ family Cbb3-type cytochrome c oxidase assembly chaperone [Amorphus coralli]|uniref:CcoQ/FixQ family Cbb3-type cytochrome c oxidase assembly chaperone n=1 Tax=Amorphus coralli TaxID=340680 RepID=UPI00036FF901